MAAIFQTLFPAKTDLETQQATFAAHATTNIKGEKALSLADFGRAIRPAVGHALTPVTDDHIALLFSVADRERRGALSFADFADFQSLLATPHAEFEILNRLIATSRKTAAASPDDVKAFFASHRSRSAAPIEFGSESLRHFLAGPAKRAVSTAELAEVVHAIQLERVRLEYKRLDSRNTGSISSEQLHTLLSQTASHRLSPALVSNISAAFPKASYPEIVALHSLLNKLDAVTGIVHKATETSKNGLISRADFSSLASKYFTYDSLTPLEIDVMFRSIGAKDGSVAILPSAFDALFNPSYNSAAEPTKPAELSTTMEIAKSAYNFGLGSVAGAIGATFVYPIDLVKTRMQNQRSKVVGQLLYNNSFDCFKKVVKNEGVLGLYRGLVPQLVGVAPEKAIKLTMNDLVRSHLKDKNTGELPLWAEILAGSSAGASQVLFTNPLEIVKIRLQVQGEVAKSGGAPRQSAVSIVRQLGVFGLYKGVGACLLRDIPFSGIYFPVYAHLKKDVFGEGHDGKKLSIVELLSAGALAGMPAAYLVTPADVIKTRLQVAARKGESTYSGITDAAVKIMREEGPRAFFKGGVARVFRSSPQFGATLASYEFLQKSLPIDFGDRPKDTNHVLASSSLSASEAGFRNTIRILGDLRVN
ncbi:mitochondrial carrier domain-containing protein [Entophlyctis helioformis]|nr:mitochondrial carrier domain-containing protein [Entophlyctis helioformis]